MHKCDKLLRNEWTVQGQKPVILDQNDPKWNWDLNFDNEDLTQFKNVKLEVWDQDRGWGDDFLRSFTVQLKSEMGVLLDERISYFNQSTIRKATGSEL